ncbi:MAG: HAD family hydrolase [Pseudomonadales bacterium]|nr:HAD family hydrolase [Pseudomonadales bacterium]
MSRDVLDRCARIRLLSLDVDGVLTDGRLIYDETGGEAKAFSTQDGQALKMLAATGVTLAIITGRRSELVARRSAELRITHLHQGAEDKRATFRALLEQLDLDASQAAHMGDDIPDLPVLRDAGLALAPANLHPALRPHVHLVTRTAGGDGAVREACEILMRARGTWDEALAAWL